MLSGLLLCTIKTISLSGFRSVKSVQKPHLRNVIMNQEYSPVPSHPGNRPHSHHHCTQSHQIHGLLTGHGHTRCIRRNHSLLQHKYDEPDNGNAQTEHTKPLLTTDSTGSQTSLTALLHPSHQDSENHCCSAISHHNGTDKGDMYCYRGKRLPALLPPDDLRCFP